MGCAAAIQSNRNRPPGILHRRKHPFGPPLSEPRRHTTADRLAAFRRTERTLDAGSGGRTADPGARRNGRRRDLGSGPARRSRPGRGPGGACAPARRGSGSAGRPVVDPAGADGLRAERAVVRFQRLPAGQTTRTRPGDPAFRKTGANRAPVADLYRNALPQPETFRRFSERMQREYAADGRGGYPATRPTYPHRADPRLEGENARYSQTPRDFSSSASERATPRIIYNRGRLRLTPELCSARKGRRENASGTYRR